MKPDQDLKPTGRRRYRIHKPWLCDPVLVLQVEFSKEYYSLEQCRKVRVCFWYDARVQDITESDCEIATSSNCQG